MKSSFQGWRREGSTETGCAGRGFSWGLPGGLAPKPRCIYWWSPADPAPLFRCCACLGRERQRERTCREAGRGKEGEREREVEGRAVQREAERLSPAADGGPGTVTAECLRLEGCPQHTPWCKLPGAYGGIITVRSFNISRACVLSPNLATWESPAFTAAGFPTCQHVTKAQWACRLPQIFLMRNAWEQQRQNSFTDGSRLHRPTHRASASLAHRDSCKLWRVQHPKGRSSAQNDLFWR